MRATGSTEPQRAPAAPGRDAADESPAATLATAVERALEDPSLPELRVARGRRTLALELGSRRYILKVTSWEPGRDRWYARLHPRTPREPGPREHANLAALWAAGLPVPRPEACGRAPQGSWVLMEYVEHRRHLAEELARADAATRRRVLDDLALLVARLHRDGWYHRDLYVPQLLPVAPNGGPGLTLLDLGRARRERRPRARWRAKDLAALHASAPAAVARTERLRFLARWLDAVGPEFGGHRPGDGSAAHRARRRAWVRRVLPRARRIRLHVPRDPGTDRAGWPGEDG